jgi:hypothetical protein
LHISQQLPLITVFFEENTGKPSLNGNNLVYKSIEFWIAISCDKLSLFSKEPCKTPSIQKPGNNFIQLQQLISPFPQPLKIMHGLIIGKTETSVPQTTYSNSACRFLRIIMVAVLAIM